MITDYTVTVLLIGHYCNRVIFIHIFAHDLVDLKIYYEDIMRIQIFGSSFIMLGKAANQHHFFKSGKATFVVRGHAVYDRAIAVACHTG